MDSSLYDSQQYEINAVKAIIRALPGRILRVGPQKLVSSQEETAEESLMNLTHDSQDTLMVAKAVFPFMLFPDSISIDRQKLTVTHRSFFSTADITSVHIHDILNVQAKVGPILGSLILSSKYFSNNIQTIHFLKRKDVLKLQRLIQGSLIAENKNINVNNIEKEQLIALLSDLGQGED